MADKSIIIDIDVTQATRNLAQVNQAIAALKAENARMKKELKDGTGDWEANSKAIAENEKAIRLLTGDQKAYTAQLQQTTGGLKLENDSYDGLNATLVQMQREYKGLTKAQRESAEGQELLKNIAATKQELKDLDAEMGDFQRNVGNYKSALGPLEGILNKVGLSAGNLAKGGLGGLKASLGNGVTALKTFSKTLLTTPVGWIAAAIAGLIAAFDKLKDAISKNDDASTGIARLYAVVVQPAIDKVTAAFGKLAEWIGKVANKLADWLGESSEAAKAADNLVKSTDALEDSERTYALNKAKRDAQIAEAREKAMDAETYSAKQRKAFLEEAMRLEDEEYNEALNLAKERERLEKERNARDKDTSDEAKNRENQLAVAIVQLDTQRANSKRALAKQLKGINAEIAKSATAAAKEEEKADEDATKAAETQAANLKKIQNELADYAVKGIKDRKTRELAELSLAHVREMEKLREQYEQEGALTEEGLQALNDLKLKKEEEYRQQYADLVASMTEGEQAEQTEVEKIEAEYAAKTEALLAAQAQLGDSEIEQRQLIDDALVAINDEKNAKIAEANKKAAKATKAEAMATAEAAVQAASQLYDSIGSVAKAFAKDEKERAKVEKAMAIGKAAIASGLAIAQGTQQAMSVPFPANLVAIVTTVATVAANVATAVKSINSAKFAGGGVVPGTSYTGDHVPARLNSAEVVLNQQQQAKLLYDIASGNAMIGGGNTVEAFSEALREMPAPVLQYTEFETFTDDVRAVRLAAEY
jgi:hypothetical protein